MGKNYQWYLVMVCGDTVQPNDPILRGWVQRVAQTPEWERERGQTTLDQVAWYSAHGYWYDMLKVIEQAQRSHPNDAKLTKLWQDVLEYAGLTEIAP